MSELHYSDSRAMQLSTASETWAGPSFRKWLGCFQRLAALGLASSTVGCLSQTVSNPAASGASTAAEEPEAAAGATGAVPASAESPSSADTVPTIQSSAPFGTYGQDTAAGSGGQVLRVTSLDPSGPGTLAEALATPGPRVIVFEIAGVIDLNRQRLEVHEPFVTIAGQTATSPGVTLIRGGLRIFTHDVLVQHLRVRMGDAGAEPASGFEPDVATEGSDAYNVIFDHMSVAWGVDENLSASGPRFDGPDGTSHRVTIQNSIIAEGLKNSVHSKGAHSDGTLVHDYCTDIAVVGNLYAHNDERNPWFKGFASGVIVNNAIYNPGRWAIRLGPVDSEWTDVGILPDSPLVSIVGNTLRYGVDTPITQTLVGSNSRGAAFLEDNVAVDSAGNDVPIASSTITELAEAPTWPDGLSAMPAGEVDAWIVAHAGARPKDRDAVDERIIQAFVDGTGEHIDSQDEVGGYPIAEPVVRALEIPDDVDAWLQSLAAELE